MGAPVFEILSERLVKPSTSTPQSLRSYKLCFRDQSVVQMYVPAVFFYPNLNQQQVSESPIRSTTERSEMSKILQIALSKTLSYYYPFAGRLRDNLIIECNDMGVHFVEAQIKCSISEFLRKSDPQVKDLVFPKSLFNPCEDDQSLVLVQLNHFSCSGMAVSICLSHKLGDASTLSAFMNDWAALVRQSSHIPSPQFVGASIFPPLDDPSTIDELITPSFTEVPVRKFFFSATKIALLKDMVAKSGVKNPTRVEVVTALLYRCAMVSSTAISTSFRPSALRHFVNLRPIAGLPKDSVGNFFTWCSIATNKDDEMAFQELVSQLRDAKVNVQNEYKGMKKFNYPMKNPTDSPSNHILDFYGCSSWCGFPLYDVDFGLGKPFSVGMSSTGIAVNCFMLMDYRNGDSIEAIVMLRDARHMSAFETNKELLAFSSLID